MDNWIEEHERLFSDTGIKLGKILWYLLKATQEMQKKSYSSAEDGKRLTDFGNEVGNDEIYWWIHKKEDNVKELEGKVHETLDSVQELKVATSELNDTGIETYADLVTVLKEFTDAYEPQINTLFEFVCWLDHKDSMAPVMLFAYRVWGSTRISERWVELDAPNLEEEKPRVLELLTEMAYGLFQRYEYMVVSVERNIASDMYDSDPENYSDMSISEAQIMVRTTHRVIEEFAIFFREIRDSLRNIKLEIEKHFAEKNLLKSEVFWKDFINKAKTPGNPESELWDFKESLEMWHTSNPRKSESQIKFCNRVAAFANHRGGAIIIGVTDETRDIVGIPDLENKMKFVSGVIQKRINHRRLDQIIHLHPIRFDQDGETATCLVVAVAQTTEVVSVESNSGGPIYPIRDQTGIKYLDQKEIERRKMHLKGEDNYGFVKDLHGYLLDK